MREGEILCEFNIRQLIQISVTVSSSGEYSAANQNENLHLACISVHMYTTIKRDNKTNGRGYNVFNHYQNKNG